MQEASNEIQEQFDVQMIATLKELISSIGPTLILLLLQESVKQINLIVLSQLKDDGMIDAFGMSNFIILSIPLSFAVTLSSLMYNLVRKDYLRSKYADCGGYLNQLMLIYLIMLVPVSVVLWLSHYILALF